jgi:hypothetical protein
MKLKDIVWGLVLVPFILILVFKDSREWFETITKDSPYLMGFIKTAILATMGELLAFRIVTGKYKGIVGLPYKFVVWGFLGLGFVLVFQIFDGGVQSAQLKGLLPSASTDTFGGKILLAFMTSLFMNLIFAPTFMLLHRVTDTYIELGNGKLKSIRRIRLDSIIEAISWKGFVGFVLIKTIPLFWIPAHTITFILPPQYRVLMAASLSIALGILLSLVKKQKLSAE